MTPFDEVVTQIHDAIVRTLDKGTTIDPQGHAINAADAVMMKLFNHTRELEKAHPEWEPAYQALAEHFGYV